jgi:hypothetical protein
MYIGQGVTECSLSILVIAAIIIKLCNNVHRPNICTLHVYRKFEKFASACSSSVWLLSAAQDDSEIGARNRDGDKSRNVASAVLSSSIFFKASRHIGLCKSEIKELQAIIDERSK